MKRVARWEIVNVNLEHTLTDIVRPADAAGVYAIIWYDTVPLGNLYLPAMELPMRAVQLRERVLAEVAGPIGRYLDEQRRASGGAPWYVGRAATAARSVMLLEEVASLVTAGTSTTGQDVSVVVCTRERPAALERCLAALMRLDPGPREIIVVDNAPSTNATCDIVAAMPGVRYVREPRPGLDIARNTGFRCARGSVVAYTDDDVEVHPKWVQQVAAAFMRPSVMAVTGLTMPAELETEAQVLFERHWSFNRGYAPVDFEPEFLDRFTPRAAPVWQIGAGANMAFRRAVFNHVGGFDERLDVGAAGCSGDSEMWYRILAAGYACRYEPAAVAFHYHRREMDALKSQLYFYMRGHVAALLIQWERHDHPANLRRLVSLFRHYAGHLARAARARFRGRYRTLFHEMAGVLSGIRFFLRNRRTSRCQDVEVEALSAVSPQYSAPSIPTPTFQRP